MDERRRNPAVERLERDSFIVLQHAHSLRNEEGRWLSAWGISGNLGLSPRDCTAIIGQLAYQGLLVWSADAPGLRIGPRGIEYLESLAGRRRSVRFGHESPRLLSAFG